MNKALYWLKASTNCSIVCCIWNIETNERRDLTGGHKFPETSCIVHDSQWMSTFNFGATNHMSSSDSKVGWGVINSVTWRPWGEWVEKRRLMRWLLHETLTAIGWMSNRKSPITVQDCWYSVSFPPLIRCGWVKMDAFRKNRRTEEEARGSTYI